MKDTFLSEVGQRVYALRKEQRLSQEQLAERAEISKQTVSVIEGGKRDILASSIVSIAEALGVSVDYLLVGKRTTEDLYRLDQKLLSLTDDQYKFMKLIIDGFLDLCTK